MAVCPRVLGMCLAHARACTSATLPALLPHSQQQMEISCVRESSQHPTPHMAVVDLHQLCRSPIQHGSCPKSVNALQMRQLSSSSGPHGAGPGWPQQDTIHIRGARFYGYHGVLPAENDVGQPFVVDLSLWCDLRAAGDTDDLQHTVSYADVFAIAQRVVEGPPHKLLESVVHVIAQRILAAYPRVQAVRVGINKVHIPKLSAAVQSVGVEVYRTRQDYSL